MGINTMIIPLALLAGESGGASASKVLPIALLASTMRSPMMGMILALAIARTESGSSTTTFSSSAAAATAVGVIGSGGDPTSFGMPEIFSLERGPDEGTMTIHGKNFGFDPNAIRVSLMWTHGGTTSSHPEIPAPKQLVSTHNSTAFTIHLPADAPHDAEITIVVKVKGVASAPNKFRHPFGSSAASQSPQKTK